MSLLLYKSISRPIKTTNCEYDSHVSNTNLNYKKRINQFS